MQAAEKLLTSSKEKGPLGKKSPSRPHMRAQTLHWNLLRLLDFGAMEMTLWRMLLCCCAKWGAYSLLPSWAVKTCLCALSERRHFSLFASLFLRRPLLFCMPCPVRPYQASISFLNGTTHYPILSETLWHFLAGKDQPQSNQPDGHSSGEP